MIEMLTLALCVAVSLASAHRLLSQRRRMAAPLDPFVESQAAPSGPLSRRMQRLDLNVSPVALVAVAVLVGLVFYAVFVEFLPGNGVPAAIASGGLIIMLFLGLKDYADWRRSSFEADLVEAMDLMNAALQGGLPPRQALLVGADASKGRVRLELGEIVERLDLGLDVEHAVRRMGNRYGSDGVRLFTQALIAKWHSGSDFGALLQAVSKLMRERVKIRLQVKGQLSGARYAAIFSGLLPYALIPFFLWKEPSWFEPLATHPQGASLLVSAVLSQMVGLIWLRRILRVQL